MDSNIWAELPQVSGEENVELSKPFTEEEIKNALFQMEINKVAGPDKIPIDFYQACWTIVKGDIVQLFADFHAETIDISRLKYRIITLLPKKSDATAIQQYRPICLLNCLCKLMTKTLTIRMEGIAEKLIHSNQTTFIKGRNIVSGIMILHEVLHETKLRNQIGIVLKLDFEKAYDKVKWKFLFEFLMARGFCPKWCRWLKQVVSGGTVSVKLNDLIGPYIKSFKGVR
jgi:hypothetical protein